MEIISVDKYAKYPELELQTSYFGMYWMLYFLNNYGPCNVTLLFNLISYKCA